MRSIVCLIILFVAMMLIYGLLGGGQVTEEFTVSIAFFGGSLVMFTILFGWNLIRNQPTRSTDFLVVKDDMQDWNIGQSGDGLPTLDSSLTWWRGYIYLQSEKPVRVDDLLLRLKRKTYHAYEFSGFLLNGKPGYNMRYIYFAIPAMTNFRQDKAEIIVATPKDDYGSGDIILRD